MLNDFFPYFSERDKLIELHRVFDVLLATVEIDEQERDGRQPLLSIDDVSLVVLAAQNDGAKEVVPIALDGCARVTNLVVVQELASEIFDELAKLFRFPPILALVVVDRVPLPVQQLPNRLRLATDLPHVTKRNPFRAPSLGLSRDAYSALTRLSILRPKRSRGAQPGASASPTAAPSTKTATRGVGDGHVQ